MQQHSGAHNVSGLLHTRFGYDNVGFHLGEEEVTMDFNGPISREELAAYLCVNRSALSRELSRMKQEGLLDYYRDTFRLLNPEALTHWAQ